MLENSNLFRNYRNNCPLSLEDAHDQAQLAILNIVQAFQGLVPDDAILKAIGNAKTPNAVSRALKNRFSPKYLNPSKRKK